MFNPILGYLLSSLLVLQTVHGRFFDDLPDPKNVALMARYVVHASNWTSISYISHDKDTNGLPMSALFSVSDGSSSMGTGVPYFYVSRLQAAVSDLMDNDPQCSLLMSLAQTDICKERVWDPEDPRCAHVILMGTFEKLNDSTSEHAIAKKAVFTRHPSFIHLPANHQFFLAKLNVTRIIIQDRFGGPSVVPVADYFKITSHASSGSKNLENSLVTLSLMLGFVGFKYCL